MSVGTCGNRDFPLVARKCVEENRTNTWPIAPSEKALRTMTKLKTFAQHMAEQFYLGCPSSQSTNCIPKRSLTNHWKATVMSAGQKMGLGFRAERDGFDGSLYEGPGSEKLIARLEWENTGLVLSDGNLPHRINELLKLKEASHDPQPTEGFFACYIGYLRQGRMGAGLNLVQGTWADAASPLLLVLTEFKKPARVFQTMSFFEICPGGQEPKPFRSQPWLQTGSMKRNT
jgi:hypothetical protein